MEGGEGPIQRKAIFENKSGKELAKRKLEDNLPRRIIAEGATMRLSSSNVGCLRLLVTISCVVSVSGTDYQAGKESCSLCLSKTMSQKTFPITLLD